MVGVGRWTSMLNPHELKQRLSYLILGQRGGHNRIQIIEALRTKPYNLNQLAEVLKLNYRTVKHHVEILLKHDIISTSRIGGYGEVYFISPDLEANLPVLEDIVRKLTTITTSPRFFQSLLEQTNDAVIILDDRLDILFWNKSAEKLFGHKAEQVMGKRIPVFPDIAALEKTVGVIKEGKTAIGFETGAVHSDGQKLVVDVTIDGIRDDQDALIGYSMISADITERNRIVEALLLSEERYALAQRAARIVSWEWEPATDAFIWSDRLGSFMGLSTAQLGGTFKDFQKRVHPDDMAKVEKEVRAALKRGTGFFFEHRMVRSNGDVRWVSETGGVAPTGKGKAVRILGIVQDITERKLAESRLSYQSILLDKVSDAIIATDERFNITYWNPAAEAIYGWRSKEVLGKPLTPLVRSKYSGAERKAVMGKLAEDGRFEGDVMQRRKDGAFIRIAAKTIALKDESGVITGYMSVNRDVTELRATEQEQKSSLDRLTQLSVRVSWTQDELEDILAPLPEPIVIFDAEGSVITVNPALSELVGYSAEELAGRPPEIFHPEDLGKVQAALAVTAAERKRTEVVARMVTKSGQTRDLSHTLAPVVRNDKVRSIIAVIHEAAKAAS
jgi:PAS domain S-box-containing protein